MAALVQVSPELVVNSGLTGNVVFPGNTTAGNLLVVLVSSVSASNIDFAVSGFASDKTKTGGNSNLGVVALSQENCAGGTTTYTINCTANSFRAIGYEFSGMATASALDASGSGSDVATSSTLAGATAPGITTTAAGVILLALSIDRTLASITGPTGWTGTASTADAVLGYQGYWSYKIFGASTSNEQGFANTSAAANCNGVLVAYKASGGGGGATSEPPRRRAFPFSILHH